MVEINNENEHKKECSSRIVYVVLFSLIIAINTGIGIYFTYFHWYLKKDNARVMLDTIY